MPATIDLSAARIIDLWDAGEAEDHVRRASLAVSVARSEWPVDELGDIGLGQRDAWLLELRRRLFGDLLEAVVRCPACREQLEVRVEVAQIRFDEPSTDATGSRLVEVELEDLSVRARTPNGHDLAAAAACADVESARWSLIRDCVLDARRSDASIAPDRLTGHELELIGEALVERDPQSEIRLGLSCALCEHQWEPVLDVARYLWEELETATDRLVDQVHVLASAYGWTEREILSLPERRRTAYVEHLTHG